MLPKEKLSEFRCIAIFGNTGSAKTSLAFRILEDLGTERQIYLLKHPNFKVIQEKGLPYKLLNTIEEIAHLDNSVILFDEPQLYLTCSEYKRDVIMARLLSLARQRNLTLIICSSDTRTFGKRVEAYFDLWLIKDCEFAMVKQRSQIRAILASAALISPEEVSISKNSFLCHNRKFPELNGWHEFDMIASWDDSLSKPYSRSKVSSGPDSHFTSASKASPPIRHFTSDLDTTKEEDLGTTSVIMSKVAENSQKTHKKLVENSQN